MHKDFADWYRLATPGTEADVRPDLLSRRWPGVEKTLDNLDNGDELALVRLLIALPGSEVPDWFRDGFKEVDESFPMKGNDLELRILAGATIAQLFESSAGTAADRAAFAIVCSTAFGDQSRRTWVVPFGEAATRYLDKRTGELRRNYTVSVPKFDAESIQTSVEAFVQAFPTNDWGRLQTTSKAALPPLVAALSQFAKTTANAISTLRHLESLRYEETNILWWMTAGYSRDFDKPFAEVALPGAAVIAAKELADLVSSPGPFAAKSVLDRVLSTCATAATYRKPLELAKVVNALPLEWRTKLVQAPGYNFASPFCPVLGAVSNSLSTEGEKDWYPAFKKAFGVEAGQKLPAVDLAFLAYRECILIRSAASLK